MFKVVVSNLTSDGTIVLMNADDNRILTSLSKEDALRLKGELSDAIWTLNENNLQQQIARRTAGDS